ncbi:MAG: TIGR02266 family protein [Polyangiaceae bacterium]
MATMKKRGDSPVAAGILAPDPLPRRDERRSHDRFEVEWSVDCVAEDTFLYAAITNISEMGIFVKTTDPLPVGTRMVMSFSPPGVEPFKLEGKVAWINALRPDGDNPNPGIGVRFVELRPDDRERLVEVIRTIAYVRDPQVTGSANSDPS